jgi:hypothetical protein
MTRWEPEFGKMWPRNPSQVKRVMKTLDVKQGEAGSTPYVFGLYGVLRIMKSFLKGKKDDVEMPFAFADFLNVPRTGGGFLWLGSTTHDG